MLQLAAKPVQGQQQASPMPFIGMAHVPALCILIVPISGLTSSRPCIDAHSGSANQVGRRRISDGRSSQQIRVKVGVVCRTKTKCLRWRQRSPVPRRSPGWSGRCNHRTVGSTPKLAAKTGLSDPVRNGAKHRIRHNMEHLIVALEDGVEEPF